jgi:bifunctional DNA-binding transcriptional regulator/antitoxin component of YhaV-PrlF toxin-antitoxin module
MYTGRFDSLIMIVTNNGDKIIISPVNPKNFINKLNDITTEKEKM